MATDAYTFYDTAVIGVTANAVHTLFQTAQGSSATRTKAQTNWPGSGALPSQNDFLIRKIGLFVNDARLDEDILLLYDQTFLEILINNQTRFLAPLKALAQYDYYQGSNELAAAAAVAMIGAGGDGYEFDPPKQLNGGVNFRVEITQGAALSVATNVCFMMHGVLTKSD